MRLTAEQALSDKLAFLLDDQYDEHLGVAVSGGSDSLALLVLAAKWVKENAFKISAVTVDHGLRPDAAGEIVHVAQVCAELGIAHDVLTWDGWDGSGNLQAQARAARLDLLDGWSEAKQVACVLLGHTADDQAETVLMHLARGSGVDGLAGIRDARDCFLRPLLDTGRDELQAVLRDRGIAWCDDPSNDDPRFDRVKARQMMGHLAELGLTRDRLVQTAKHMQSAQSSLTEAAGEFAKANVRLEGGDLLVPKRVFYGIAGDTQARVISSALMWIGRQAYRPRYAALLEMAHAAARGKARTLHGVQMTPEGDDVRMSREYNAIDSETADIEVSVLQDGYPLWDGRWGVFASAPRRSVLPWRRAGKLPSTLTIRALGEHIKDVPDWRDTGLPRTSLMASPAVFDGETLIAAPVAGLQSGFCARIVADFTSFLLSR